MALPATSREDREHTNNVTPVNRLLNSVSISEQSLPPEHTAAMSRVDVSRARL